MIFDEAWKEIDIKNEGLYIWRIENFKIKPIDKNDYGKFYEGDSYIVFNIYLNNKELKYDVHFWIGQFSTSDEYGTAVYKTIELDQYVQNRAIQHRELQFYESKLFASYFDKIVYLSGGIPSGYHLVSDKIEPQPPKLLYFYDKQHHILTNHLNYDNHYVYILDNITTIDIFLGEKSSKTDQYLANCFVNKLLTQRKNSEINYIDNYNEFKNLIEKANFDNTNQENTIYHISDEYKNQIKQINNITLKNLNTGDSYLFITKYDIYIWIGKESSLTEIKRAWDLALRLKLWKSITLIKESLETESFIRIFA